MTRADWVASVPKCDHTSGSALAGSPCARALRWIDAGLISIPEYGAWVCSLHGPRFSGSEAARRAGYAGAVAA